MKNLLFMKIIKILILCLILFLVLYTCKKTHKTEKTFTPVPFPKHLSIEGFNFPERSSEIYKWLDNQDTTMIVKHAWGLWAGLTEPTKEYYNGQNLLVFETWMGVEELVNMSTQGIIAQEGKTKYKRTPLSVPKQFLHGQLLNNEIKSIDTNFLVLETVSYNPTAAYFLTKNQLFNKSKLMSYVILDGIGEIKQFPKKAIATKPTYYAGVPNKNGLIRLPIWENPKIPKAYKYTEWQKWVYVDINNRQKKDKKLIPVTSSKPTQSQIKAATCNINDFINYKIDQIGADYLNSKQDITTEPDRKFVEGDYVILVAMHVSTKEIDNWTWQTFFWCPDPSNPPSPSSKFESSLKPKELKGAASHYALSVAYAMVWPNQPITGGTDKNGRPIISFNPYLEGGFGPRVFSNKNNFRPNFIYGMQTNCMSCHALATMRGKNSYITDQYVDMMDTSLFKNDVKLDFLWSIQGNMDTTK